MCCKEKIIWFASDVWNSDKLFSVYCATLSVSGVMLRIFELQTEYIQHVKMDAQILFPIRKRHLPTDSQLFTYNDKGVQDCSKLSI